MRSDAEKIYKGAIEACLPDRAVEDALSSFKPKEGRVIMIAIGKAAWRMASQACKILGDSLSSGVVITKYGHSEGELPKTEIYEAAHPVPDENGIRATERVLEITSGLSDKDTVLFLISGGGSALFESPECSLSELSDITSQLLASGASINEINAVRKHLSRVKGGRFAEHVYPAHVFAVALSDVLGNSLDTIASGPAYPDSTTVDDVKEIIKKYSLKIPDGVMPKLMRETPKEIKNAEHYIGGSVSELCAAAAKICTELGYETTILTDNEHGEACHVGERLAALACEHYALDSAFAFIIGGETVVKLHGSGLGGRNQEIALSAAINMDGLDSVAVFSVGSDGTDGPTDAAGGYADGTSAMRMKMQGVDPIKYLEDNDSYHALLAVGDLIFTGATGTNVNDISVLLVRPSTRKRKFENLERVMNYGLTGGHTDA